MRHQIKTFIFLVLLFTSIANAGEDLLEKARNLYGTKKYDEALRVLWEYDKLHPDTLASHDIIQRIYEKQSKREEAIALYKERYSKSPTGFNSYLYIRMLDAPSEQEKLFREAILKDAKSIWVHYGLANALMDQDKLQQGIDEGSKGLLIVTQPARLHYVLARIYRRMKDYKNAAIQARSAYMLDPSNELADLKRSYSWMHVTNEENSVERFRLAQEWFKQNRQSVMESEDLDAITKLAELAFILAENEYNPAQLKTLAGTGLKALSKLEIPESGEYRDLYFRIQGALRAIQGLVEAKQSNPTAARRELESAEKSGPASETFFFASLAYHALEDREKALQNALQAASFPPVFRGSKDLALARWKEIHSTENGFDDALQKQRDLLAGDRKKKILEQQVSEKFQAFEMTDPAGKTLSEKDFAGKIVLINFWAVWCPPCREELPHWNQFYSEHKNDSGLLLVAVGDEPWETMQNYLKNNSFNFPVYRNEKYWEQFSVDGIPTMVVIDPDGTIRFRNTGFEKGMEYEETLLWQIEAVKNAAAS